MNRRQNSVILITYIFTTVKDLVINNCYIFCYTLVVFCKTVEITFLFTSGIFFPSLVCAGQYFLR